MKIGIVVGSIREGRLGASVGAWVFDQASTRTDAEFELVDLKAFDLPLLTSESVPGSEERMYASAEVTAWSRAIDALDGYVFVTPEYNHSVPGAFKNAIDSIYPEWAGKAVGFVSYGAERGVRAVEAWRPIVATLQMYDIRPQVSMSTYAESDGTTITPNSRRAGELTRLLEQLVALTTKLRS